MSGPKIRSGMELWDLFIRSNNGDPVSDANFLGTLQHANTADRVYTLPDTSGNLLTDTSQLAGLPISSWVNYIPTLTNITLGTGGTANLRYRRVGDSIQIKGLIVLGTSGVLTGIAYFSLPTSLGITPDLTKLSRDGCYARVGIASAYDSGGGTTARELAVVVWNESTSAFYIEGRSNAGVSSSYNATFPFTWASTDFIEIIDITIPISQWTSSINLSKDFQEFAYNSSINAATDTVSFANGPIGAAVQAFAPTGLTSVIKRINFTNPIAATDILILEFFNGSVWIEAGVAGFGFYGNGSANFGCSITPLNTNQVNVLFYSQAQNGSAWSNWTSWRWRVRKISNGNFAQGTPTVSTTKLLDNFTGTTATSVGFYTQGGPIILSINGGCYNAAANTTLGIDIQIDNIKKGTMYKSSSAGVGQEHAALSTTIYIPNLAVGYHSLTFVLYPNCAVNTSDSFSVLCQEFIPGTSSYVDVYSSNEVITNKVWINGKVIYRKVIVGNIPANTTSTNYSNHGIVGVTQFTSISYCGIDANMLLSGYITLRPSATNVAISLASAITLPPASASIYITLEYTK